MEEKSKSSCLSKGCFGCAGITALIIALLLIGLIGGSYWIIKYKALQETPIQVVNKPLAQEEIVALEQKLQSPVERKSQPARFSFSESELTYLINKELQKAKKNITTSDREKVDLDIAAVDVAMDSNEMDLKVSIKLNNRYLNIQALGTPNITGNELRFDTRKIKLGQLEFKSGNITGAMNSQLNTAIETKIHELHYQQYMDDVDQIFIEDGKLVVDLKKSDY